MAHGGSPALANPALAFGMGKCGMDGNHSLGCSSTSSQGVKLACTAAAPSRRPSLPSAFSAGGIRMLASKNNGPTFLSYNFRLEVGLTWCCLESCKTDCVVALRNLVVPDSYRSCCCGCNCCCSRKEPRLPSLLPR